MYEDQAHKIMKNISCMIHRRQRSHCSANYHSAWRQ